MLEKIKKLIHKEAVEEEKDEMCLTQEDRDEIAADLDFLREYGNNPSFADMDRDEMKQHLVDKMHKGLVDMGFEE